VLDEPVRRQLHILFLKRWRTANGKPHTEPLRRRALTVNGSAINVKSTD
jgi:hypothetical protein